MKKIFLLLFVAASLTAAAQTKPGYAIDFKVNGLRDSTVYLGNFFAESTYICDTAKVNTKGEFTFNGKKALQQGWYFLVINKSRKLDVMIGPNQHFSLETDTAEFRKPIKKVTFKNDIDNTLYYDNMAHNAELSKKAEPYVKILQDTTLKDEVKKKEAQEALKKIREEAEAYRDNIITKHPETFTARLFKTTQNINVPDPPKRADGSIDSLFQLKYYREHFFDNFDLTDDALTRVDHPIYNKKVAEYLDKLYAQHPDTIMNAISKVVDMAKKNPETYKFIVWTLTNKYLTPEFMGMDEVFVQIYYKYYASGEMDYWTTEKHRKNLKDQAEKYCRSLVGRTGPNLIMQDENFQPRSMYDIKAKYTILYIYDPECGSCKKETPVLVNFYNKNKTKLSVEVFAVGIDTTMAIMRAYIKEMGMKWINVNGPRTYLKVSYRDQYDADTTPTIYILDSNHKIIGKKLPAAKIEEFLINYEKMLKRKAALKQPDRVPFDCSKLNAKPPIKS